jgi:hypothetical protein
MPRPTRIPVQSPAKHVSKSSSPLYQPLDFVLVRAPLLPVERYCLLKAASKQAENSANSSPVTTIPDMINLARSDPYICRALAVGSSALFAALNRPDLSPSATARVKAKLLRFLIRMSTRPTPYGLFAGVALGTWGRLQPWRSPIERRIYALVRIWPGCWIGSGHWKLGGRFASTSALSLTPQLSLPQGGCI